MKEISISKSACIFLLLIVVCHMAYFWPHLPDKMATHFGANWEPDGWMSKNMFMLTYAGLIGIISMSFLGSIALMKKVPHSMINLPKKEYWLAPERKDETMDYLSETMLRLHNITITFLVAIMHMTIKYNTSGQKIDSELFWILFVAFMGYTVFWSVWLIVHFMRVPAAQSE